MNQIPVLSASFITIILALCFDVISTRLKLARLKRELEESKENNRDLIKCIKEESEEDRVKQRSLDIMVNMNTQFQSKIERYEIEIKTLKECITELQELLKKK